MIKNLLFTTIFSFLTVFGFSQCLDWVNPSPTTGWNDLGEAPCNGEFTEMIEFEIWQSEAYSLTGVVSGGSYTFSACNGAGAGSWDIDYTILSPSGAVDAFGSDADSPCSITWTASESGIYLIVINKVGECGADDNVENGFPKIMTNSGGIDCVVIPEGAESFEGSATNLPACWESVDADGDGFSWGVIDFTGTSVNAFEGNHIVASYSYDNSSGAALTPNNYLITPKLNIEEGNALYYGVRAIDLNFPAEKYSVVVSTTGTQVTDFTEVLFTETLTNAAWDARMIDLSAYAGQSIYLAFRHYESSDEFAIMLDMIYLPGVECIEAGVEEANNQNAVARIFPNPASNQLYIASPLHENAVITIFDATGRMVMQNEVKLMGNVTVQDIANIENGAYLIQVNTGDQVVTQRFIKQ